MAATSAPRWTTRGRHSRPDPDWPTGEDWEDRAERIGVAATPLLEDLLDEFPESIVAMVCTGAGFNLCAVGLTEEAVGRFAALSSSLHAVSSASVGALPGEKEAEPLDVVSVQAGRTLLLSITFEHPDFGELVLAAAVAEVTLGELLLKCRMTSTKLARELAKI